MSRAPGYPHQRLTLETYQRSAGETAMYPGIRTFDGLLYCTLKLNGEAGEVAEIIGKSYRDQDSILTAADREHLMLELGDVLWYVQQIATELNVSLETVATANLQKLFERHQKPPQSASD